MFKESESPKLPFNQFLPPERSPFSPSGEKVAVRPDEGGFPGGQHGIMKERFSGDQTCSPSARVEGVDVGRTNYYLYPKVAL